MCGVLNEWIERLTTKISCTHFHVVNHQLSQLKGLFFRVEQQSLDLSFFRTQTRKYRSTAQKYTLSVADALQISFFFRFRVIGVNEFIHRLARLPIRRWE